MDYLSAADHAIITRSQPFTMTSVERLAAMLDAVRYLNRFKIPGCLVECGVWRGGSMMSAAWTLQECGDTARNLYLFDTYEGMPQPTEVDRKISTGVSAMEKFAEKRTGENSSDWCYASLEEVRANLQSTGYPKERLHFIKGKVEDTLPTSAPNESIALLRLDTDFYASTQMEMELLFPKLVRGGVLIIDDYGSWEGSRRAVDEYLTAHSIPLLLNRIDKPGRIAVKI